MKSFLQKLSPYRTALILVLLALCSAVVGFILILKPFSPQNMAMRSSGFTYYSPTNLPDGVSIKSRQIFARSYYSGGDPSKKVTNTTINLSFRTVDNVYAINESPISNYKSADDFMGTDANNYDSASTTPTCKIVRTDSSRYRLCHWYDYGDTYSVYEMRFVKGTTAIDINLNSPDKRVLSDDEITRFVSSFAPSNPNDLELREMTGGA